MLSVPHLWRNAVDRRFFLGVCLGLENTIAESGSGLILDPRGLCHCCGILVQASVEGTSVMPRFL